MFDPQVPERHQRVIRALQSGPRAPDSLRQRIEELDAAAAPRSPLIPLLRRRPLALRLRPAAVVAGVSVLLTIALVVALSLGGPGGPSVVQAAELGMRPSMEAAPATDPQQPALLEHSFEGVAFPDWSEQLGWRANGARSDALDGRRTETVFYTHEGHRIGYTVIAGEPLDPPAGAETLRVDGVQLHRLRDGNRDIVTFERNGRTCVLSGHVLHRDTLLKLASWKGNGSVQFQ